MPDPSVNHTCLWLTEMLMKELPVGLPERYLVFFSYPDIPQVLEGNPMPLVDQLGPWLTGLFRTVRIRHSGRTI